MSVFPIRVCVCACDLSVLPFFFTHICASYMCRRGLFVLCVCVCVCVYVISLLFFFFMNGAAACAADWTVRVPLAKLCQDKYTAVLWYRERHPGHFVLSYAKQNTPGPPLQTHWDKWLLTHAHLCDLTISTLNQLTWRETVNFKRWNSTHSSQKWKIRSC